MSRLPRLGTCLLVLLALTALSCKGRTRGEKTVSPWADVDLPDYGPGGSDSEAPGPDGPARPEDVPPTPVSELTVDTGVSSDGPTAGEEIKVFCSVLGLAPDQEEPATHWEVSETPSGIAHSPEITGDTVVFKSAGDYLLRCIIDETGWIDPTPSKVMVSPGAAVEIGTQVEPAALAAGTVGAVSCTGADEFGNTITDDWKVVVAPGGPQPGPEGGLVESNFQVKALIVGTYEVACAQKGGLYDETPVVVSVAHGLPYRLVTTLGQEVIKAGGSTNVTCHSEDKWGNTVPDLPMSLVKPDSIALTGLTVSGTKLGKYSIKCVPAGLDWTAFVLEHAVLEITAADPATLDLVLQPDKPFYTPYEVVTVLALSEDVYGNVLADAALEPLEVDPPTGWKATSPKTFVFFQEGYFTISGRLANDPSISDSLELSIAGSPPVLSVTYPPRGATILGFKPSVTVEGFANQPIVAIKKVMVNEWPAYLDLQPDGSFKFTGIVIPKWGLNVFEVVAIDEADHETRTKQSFYFADKYLPSAPEAPLFYDALKGWLSAVFIDDGVHNPNHPDDLASLLLNVIKGFDLNALLPGSIPVGGPYELKLSNLEMSVPQLAMQPGDGYINVVVSIKNIYIKVKLKGECKLFGIDFCPDFSGKVKVDAIHINSRLYASATEGKLDVSLDAPSLSMSGLDVDIDGILGWLFDWLIDFLVDMFAGTIEEQFEAQMADAIEDLMAGLFDSVEFVQTLDIAAPLPGMDDISLTLEAYLWSLLINKEGVTVDVAARITAVKKIAQEVLGSIARGTCLKGLPQSWEMPLPPPNEFAAATYDDLFNSVLTTVWQNGVLNISLDETTIAELMAGDGEGGDGGIDLGGLPIDGLTVDATFLLPPIINGCKSETTYFLQVGDVLIDVDLWSPLFEGGKADLGVYLYAEIEAELYMEDDGYGEMAFKVAILDMPALDYHWDYVPEEFEGAEDTLEALIEDQLLGPALESLVGEPLFSFSLPEIDLFTLSPLFPEGTLIKPVIDTLERHGGHWYIDGYVE